MPSAHGPSGAKTDNRERAKNEISKFKKSIGACLLKATGAGDMIDKLINLTQDSEVGISFGEGNKNKYSPYWNHVFIVDLGPSVWVHEFVHVYDDWNQIYLGDWIVNHRYFWAENLAFGFEAFLARLENVQSQINIMNKGLFNCERDGNTLGKRITSLGEGGYNIRWGYTGSSTATDFHMSDVHDKLGLRVKCEEILKCLPIEKCDIPCKDAKGRSEFGHKCLPRTQGGDPGKPHPGKI